MFLSSHILSEVEALCDRVAILRTGELLEIGTLAEMGHLSAFSVHATFEGPPPDVSHIVGVSSVEVHDHSLQRAVAGSIEPLIRALSNVGVRELVSTKPSLEELFLSHYGTLLATSPAIAATLGRLGMRRATEGYLGMAFFFDALLIAVVAAGQIAAIRDEEASGRLDNLLVRPVTRVSWLAGRIAVSFSTLVLADLGAGLFTWLGAVSQHVNESLWKLLEAGVNATIPGNLCLAPAYSFLDSARG